MFICKCDYFHIGPLDESICQIVNTDYIKHDGLMMVWAEISLLIVFCFNDFCLIFKIFINIHKYSN